MQEILKPVKIAEPQIGKGCVFPPDKAKNMISEPAVFLYIPRKADGAPSRADHREMLDIPASRAQSTEQQEHHAVLSQQEQDGKCEQEHEPDNRRSVRRVMEKKRQDNMREDAGDHDPHGALIQTV